MRLGIFILVLLLLKIVFPCEATEKQSQDLNDGAYVVAESVSFSCTVPAPE